MGISPGKTGLVGELGFEGAKREYRCRGDPVAACGCDETGDEIGRSLGARGPIGEGGRGRENADDDDRSMTGGNNPDTATDFGFFCG